MLGDPRRICTRCGDGARDGACICARCGTRVAPDPAAGAAPPATTFLDTINFPGMTEGEVRQTRVRPVLAVLFRVAVGPSADYYAPRFLKYEKSGHGAPGWHWPSFWLPSVWAFYRKLWFEGFLFALLPVAGALAFAKLAPRIDNVPVPWLVAAVLAIWLLPGVIPALLANSLLYRRVRQMVRRAEASSASAAQVASDLGRRAPVSLSSAILLGGGAILLAASLVEPDVRGAYFEHEVRAKVSAALASVRPLQQQIEENWARLQAIPRKLDVDSLRLQAASAFFDEVSFRPANGRLRLALGSSIPELFGRSILLAPALDPSQRIQWMCIPIDIPAKYLPKECRSS
jgi:hypothetical protein